VLLRLEPGSVAITSSLEPANFSFEPGRGQVESGSERAAGAARALLTTPNLVHPQLEAAVGAVEFVLAPFAAGYGALSARHRVLPADKLAEADEELTQAMRSMAGQERLRELLLQCAGEKTRRRLVSLPALAAEGQISEPVSAMVETTVESLQLKRTGAGKDSYALRMTARTRVVRTADGAVVFDRHYEFRSEEAMFIDWARPGGFESVARTGYRNLAERIAQDVFVAPAGEPLQLGPAVAASTPSSRRVAWKQASRARLSYASFRTGKTSRQLAMKQGAPPVEVAAFRVADNGSFEIYSGGAMSDLLIQGPPAKEEPVAEGSTETEWVLGGLENDRNSVVQAAACLAAVPLGLWEQTIGLLRPRPTEELDLAERDLKLVARRMQPHQVLADAIAQALAPQASHPILLVKEPFLCPAANEPVPVPCRYEPTRARFTSSETGPASVTESGAGTAVEMRLVEARLARRSGLRSRLALCVEAQVTLIRKSDGQELYSFPVSYRSAGKSLKAWAGGDAEMFRGELNECCREMGTAAAQELVSCGLVAPRPEPTPAFAQK